VDAFAYPEGSRWQYSPTHHRQMMMCLPCSVGTRPFPDVFTDVWSEFAAQIIRRSNVVIDFTIAVLETCCLA
jgi:hypothetical protein